MSLRRADYGSGHAGPDEETANLRPATAAGKTSLTSRLPGNGQDLRARAGDPRPAADPRPGAAGQTIRDGVGSPREAPAFAGGLDDPFALHLTTPGSSAPREIGRVAKQPLAIDWETIKSSEKTRHIGYVPANLKNGKLVRILNSGVTGATGVDLGRQDPSKLGLSDLLAAKLKPYHGLTPAQINAYANTYPDEQQQKVIVKWKARQAKKLAAEKTASKPVDTKPDTSPLRKLELTDREMEELDRAVKQKFEDGLEKAFNRAGKSKLRDLPAAAQTALMSTYYNSPGWAQEELFAKLHAGDYLGARNALYDFSKPTAGINNRRHHDGEIMNNAVEPAKQQSYDSYAAEKRPR